MLFREYMKPLTSKTICLAIEALCDDIRRSNDLLKGFVRPKQKEILERHIEWQKEAILELRQH